MHWKLALLVVASSIGLVGASIPVARWLGILDKPGALKIHYQPIPRFGGIGIVLTLLIWGIASGKLQLLEALGLGLVALTGALDDRFSLPPSYRILAEAVAGVILGLGAWTEPRWAGIVLGATLVTVLTNAINLIDGMNGLVAGSTVVYSAGMALLMLQDGQSAELALMLGSASLGFLVWNFPVARTFMGDTGSLAIGYMLSVLILRLVEHWKHVIAGLLMLGFPLLDMGVGVLRRWRRGRSILSGDRDHLYDRLYRVCGSATLTVVMAWAISVIFVAAGWLIRDLEPIRMALVLAIIGVASLWGAARLGAV